MLAGPALLLIAAAARGPGGAGAADGQGMSAMLIDMDPFSPPVNTSTSLGPNETCARINVNGALDADEDVEADTLVIDVTAHDIPRAAAMIAYNYSLRYDEAALTVQSEVFDDPAINILMSNPGSNLFNPTDPVPDVDGTNAWNASMIDVGDVPGESGSGVLTRLAMSSDRAAATGTYMLSLAFTVHLDLPGGAYFPGNVNWDSDADGELDGVSNLAAVAVNRPCGEPPAPPPATAPPGVTVTAAPAGDGTPAPGDRTPAATPPGADGAGATGTPSTGSPTGATPHSGTASPSGITGGGPDDRGGGSSTGVIVAAIALAGGALAAASGGGWLLHRRRKSGTS